MLSNDTLPHEIVFVCGKTGSGKTHLLAKRLGPRHRRRITIDLVGEGRKLYPQAYQAIGLRAVYRALRSWVGKEITGWHMIAVLTNEEVGALMWKLCPIFDGRTDSLAALLGGVCVETYEIDVLMPVNGSGKETAKAFKNAFARGRHVGLSLLAATQRPAQCDRIVTSQSNAIISFHMHEPRDLAWLRDVGGSRLAEEVRALGKYESAWYHAENGHIITRDPDYRVIRRFTPDSASAEK